MKKRLLVLISGAFVYMFMSGNVLGPASFALNATGSPGSTTSCGNCHSGGGGTTTNTVELRKLSGGPEVTQYIPDTNYIVTVKGNNASISHFGFQLTALNIGNTNAGSFSNFPATMHIGVAGGKNIVEHTDQLPKTNNQYEAVFHWKAPSAGTGTVSFYGVINAVNNDGGLGGDRPGTPFTVQLTEATTGVAETPTPADIKIYPNPVSTQLNIELANAGNDYHKLQVTDLAGRIMYTNPVTIRSGNANISIETASWPQGLYFVHLSDAISGRTVVISKQ
jgi:hypothetical protein